MDHDATDTGALPQPDVHEMLRIINRDLRGANALARACLAGLATVSSEAREAITSALAGQDEHGGGFNPEAVVARTWEQLNIPSPVHERLCAALERALVSKAAEIEDGDSEIRRRA
jgi:hypothetical protein